MEHRIFFELNEHVSIAVLSEIMREFEQIPQPTEYYGNCAFFIILEKEDAKHLMDQYGWAIVAAQDFDQKKEGGDYICGNCTRCEA